MSSELRSMYEQFLADTLWTSADKIIEDEKELEKLRMNAEDTERVAQIKDRATKALERMPDNEAMTDSLWLIEKLRELTEQAPPVK